jgi:hypothetical protein
MVTKEAISSTKIGIRTSLRMVLRKIETVVLEATNTKVVASPKLIELVILLVTANSGHKPNNATKA